MFYQLDPNTCQKQYCHQVQLPGLGSSGEEGPGPVGPGPEESHKDD